MLNTLDFDIVVPGNCPGCGDDDTLVELIKKDRTLRCEGCGWIGFEKDRLLVGET